MGLDWNPIGKPKPGHEDEFERLFDLLKDGGPPKPSLLSRLFGRAPKVDPQERWSQIQITPYETLGAPRVGRDEAAEEWLRREYDEGRTARKPWERLLAEMEGYYVLELLPTCDGLPLYTNSEFQGGPERFSFRAKFLDDCKEVIGSDLLTEAWEHPLPQELEKFGRRLESAAVSYAGKIDVADRIRGREIAYTADEEERFPDIPVSRAHIVTSAARWCLFWSQRGHGQEADF